MKSMKLLYWIPTALLVVGFAGGGVVDLLGLPGKVEEMSALGYPLYLMTLLGLWKLLAVIALAVPRCSQLKEWAYAGLVFDLTGAAYSHVASGSGVDKAVAPVVFLVLTLLSWATRPESRRLPGTLFGN